MPNYRRLFVPGGTYAFTVCLADRRADTLVRYIDNFRDAWRDMKTRRPVETIAACILPDHFHVIWTLPEDDFDYPARFNHLKGGFTRRLPDELKSDGRKRERGIWQRRYWEHLIRDERDLAAHMDYVHWNPVKHGYVSDPADWPHSTWHRYKDEWNREWRSEAIEIGEM